MTERKRKAIRHGCSGKVLNRSGKTLSCFARTILFGLFTSHIHAAPPPAESPTQTLARELSQQGSHREAAIEYRRLALGTTNPLDQAGFNWVAAYEHLQAEDVDIAAKLLDRIEDATDQLRVEALLLRAEAANRTHDNEVARFYLESLLKAEATPQVRTFAGQRLASVLIREGLLDSAEQTLKDLPEPAPGKLLAIKNYRAGRDKSVWVGGILGLVPGLGYAYSGEYANGLRAAILNGLFMYAMVATADDEQWGAFAALSFFELTWYTGSVYGGIDAADRYNRRRRKDCTDAVDGQSAFAPIPAQLPVVSLRYRF